MQVGQEAGDVASYYNNLINQISGAGGAAAASVQAEINPIQRSQNAGEAVGLAGYGKSPEPLASPKPLRAARFTDYEATRPQLSPLDEAMLYEFSEEDELADLMAMRRARLSSANAEPAPATHYYELGLDSPYPNTPQPYDPFTGAEPTIIELVASDGDALSYEAQEAERPKGLLEKLFERAASRYENNRYIVENQRPVVSFAA